MQISELVHIDVRLQDEIRVNVYEGKYNQVF